MTRWLAATALLLALGGCGDDATRPETVPVPATTTSGTATRAMATESTTAGAGTATTTGRPRASRTTAAARDAAGPDGFVATVRDRLPEVALDRRDEELAAIGRQACADLAGGLDADKIVARTRSLGTADAEATDQATARELVKLAIDTICPDQDRRVDEF
ncbi:DUF732 domain-containing protein [Actinoplanes sp. NPDC049548]|uniref:DUF732 domain-containing protein n=1 Tax=Actinoplanes sp. NPDC049548 TaxID=3155152 RepID=UPI003431347A